MPISLIAKIVRALVHAGGPQVVYIATCHNIHEIGYQSHELRPPAWRWRPL